MPQALQTPSLKPGPPHPQGPAAVITRRAADRLREGSVWVYRSEIEQLLPGPNAIEVPPGCLVTVLDARGIPLGTATFSAASQITLRLISTSAALSRAEYLRLIAARVESATALREKLAPISEENNA
jgi:23S rRNA (cytosine1962-C5)-methyltransferase